jgi:hypothetical protein
MAEHIALPKAASGFSSLDIKTQNISVSIPAFPMPPQIAIIPETKPKNSRDGNNEDGHYDEDVFLRRIGLYFSPWQFHGRIFNSRLSKYVTASDLVP